MKESDIRKREAFNRYLELVQEDVQRFMSDRAKFVAVACPACQGQAHDAQFVKNGFSYVLCVACGTLFANPRPSLEALCDFYKDSQSSRFWVDEFFKPVAEARREKIFQPRVEFVRDHLPDCSSGVIGDIGAGFGIFLEELGKHWSSAKMIAIEPSLEMVEICKNKNLEVIPCAIEDVQGWEGSFDLLTAYELLEHLHDPANFLKRVVSLLRPGGHLLITTLNGEGFDVQILWEASKSVSPPHHLNFFNPASICRLLKNNDLEVVQLTTPGRLDWDIVESMYRTEGVDPGRFWKLIANKSDGKIKDGLQKWLAHNGFSSHMQVLARKKV